MKVPKCLAWWRVDEQDRQEKETKLYQNCQNEVRERWERGDAPPCFTRTYLEQGHRFGFPTDIEAAFNVGMVSMAGIHTTSSPLHTFFLAMTLHPEWMARLQKDRTFRHARSAHYARDRQGRLEMEAGGTHWFVILSCYQSAR